MRVPVSPARSEGMSRATTGRGSVRAQSSQPRSAPLRGSLAPSAATASTTTSTLTRPNGACVPSIAAASAAERTDHPSDHTRKAVRVRHKGCVAGGEGGGGVGGQHAPAGIGYICPLAAASACTARSSVWARPTEIHPRMSDPVSFTDAVRVPRAATVAAVPGRRERRRRGWRDAGQPRAPPCHAGAAQLGPPPSVQTAGPTPPSPPLAPSAPTPQPKHTPTWSHPMTADEGADATGVPITWRTSWATPRPAFSATWSSLKPVCSAAGRRGPWRSALHGGLAHVCTAVQCT
jgi:hypothetical protein